MRAMILSAGYGTRLWPLTEDRTKPAIPILGKPLVGYVAEYLASMVATRSWSTFITGRILSARALGDGSKFGVKLYTLKSRKSSAQGCVGQRSRYLQEETLSLSTERSSCDIDLERGLQTHRDSGAIATLVLLPNTNRERFTVVETSDGFAARIWRDADSTARRAKNQRH